MITGHNIKRIYTYRCDSYNSYMENIYRNKCVSYNIFIYTEHEITLNLEVLTVLGNNSN